MLNLHDRDWKEFYIKDIFFINPGKRLTKTNMIDGNKPFIGATDSNNGVTAFVSNSNIDVYKRQLHLIQHTFYKFPFRHLAIIFRKSTSIFLFYFFYHIFKFNLIYKTGFIQSGLPLTLLNFLAYFTKTQKQNIGYGIIAGKYRSHPAVVSG